MMRNMMNSGDPSVLAENARTLRNQGQPEDIALKMAAKRAAMGAAVGGGADMGGIGGMQKEVMPEGAAMGALGSGAVGAGQWNGAPAMDAGAMGGPMMPQVGNSMGVMPMDASAGAVGAGTAGGIDPNAPAQPTNTDWIKQLIGRLGQGGSMAAQPGYQTQGGMSTLAGLLGRR